MVMSARTATSYEEKKADTDTNAQKPQLPSMTQIHIFHVAVVAGSARCHDSWHERYAKVMSSHESCRESIHNDRAPVIKRNTKV